MLKTAEFPTYEAEIAALEQECGLRVPLLSGGAARALRESSAWLLQAESATPGSAIAVLPDPSLNLSLPYPGDELSLALTRTMGRLPIYEEIGLHAATFALSEPLLDRPTTALSGGERMLLSLAKARALATPADSLFICSPFFWLDDANRSLVHQHFDRPDGRGARLLVLEGEGDDSRPFEQTASMAVEAMDWHLEVDELLVRFAPQSFPRASVGKALSFSALSGALSLQSPTLIEGRNGVGKSTLARVLCGLAIPTRGRARASVRGLSGTARLLLQDAVLQLMGQPISEYLARVFRFDGRRAKGAVRALPEDAAAMCLDGAIG